MKTKKTVKMMEVETLVVTKSGNAVTEIIEVPENGITGLIIAGVTILEIREKNKP